MRKGSGGGIGGGQGQKEAKVGTCTCTTSVLGTTQRCLFVALKPIPCPLSPSLARSPPPCHSIAGTSNREKAKDFSKKAVLLSGPPGIGKTSSAHIISK